MTQFSFNTIKISTLLQIVSKYNDTCVEDLIVLINVENGTKSAAITDILLNINLFPNYYHLSTDINGSDLLDVILKYILNILSYIERF